MRADTQKSPQTEIIRIVAVYSLFGGLWIYLSDTFLGFVLSDPAVISRVSMYKGLVFIALTAILLYILIARYAKRISANMSELNQAEAAFRAVVVRQDAILSAVPDIIMEVDSNKIYTWSNSAGFEFFGENVIGTEVSLYFAREQNTYEIIQPLFTGTEKIVYVESWQRRKDGEVRLLAWWCKAIEDDAGVVTGTLSTARDITLAKQYEKALQDKNTELERFTYTVSHDLKSPIITIKGFTGALKKDLQDGRYERMAGDLKRVSAAADKMNDLLCDLLKLSTVGHIIDASVPVDMNLLVDDVLAQLAGPLEQRSLTVGLQEGLPTVFCDRQRMAEVIQNLLENAITYMGHQSKPQIQFGMRDENGIHVFFVQDNGIGIDEKYHQIIFGLFNKLDAKSAGTGVGLALVKRIIEAHGGRVWVESEGKGAGSRFCFTVPPLNSRM